MIFKNTNVSIDNQKYSSKTFKKSKEIDKKYYVSRNFHFQVCLSIKLYNKNRERREN